MCSSSRCSTIGNLHNRRHPHRNLNPIAHANRHPHPNLYALTNPHPHTHPHTHPSRTHRQD